MRDTVRLRRRLEVALALIPACTLANCEAGGAPEPAAPAIPDPADSESETKATPGRTAVPDEPAAPQVAPPAKPSRFDPIAGDPPFVDGYNPEEVSCPAGNWCAMPNAVLPLAIRTAAETMGCPERISGTGFKGIDHDDPAYRGLSRSPAMLGAFNEGRATRRRDDGQEGLCCYHWFEYCSGRPILEGDIPRTAKTRAGHGWGATADAGPSPTDPELARTLAAEWTRDALAEHAAIASFARATLELLAVGAPAELVVRTQQAGADEVDHARRCFALADRHGGANLEPGPLPAPAPRPADLARLAADTFEEGCVGETIATLQATRALGPCRDPTVRETLEVIAEDEANHAALAWATVDWCLQAGGRNVAEALAIRADRYRRVGPTPLIAANGTTLATWGRLDAGERARAAEDAWRDIIGPMLDERLARG